ncbi:MAG TPA: histidine kinase [Chitinophagaceae bacterium]|nr:histidine kinase [Chitinophagaceae bacterium]
MRFLNKRIFPGFKIGEVLAYVAFNYAWFVLLGTIYIAGDRFSDKTFVSIDKFFFVNMYSIPAKMLFLLPWWWLYFKKLKHKPFTFRLPFHLLTAPVYAVTMIGAIHVYFAYIIHEPYTKGYILSDFYNFIVYYFFQFSIFHGYNFYLHTKAQLLKEQALKDLAHESEIKALKAQIEPHFLFNTLNSISASVPPSLEKTRVLIAQLADIFRYALKVSERQTVRLEEEVDFIKTWLALEKHRFHGRLHVEYKVEPTCLQVKVPPMILQPIVENALNHGISPKIEGGTVTIECKPQGKFACIAVCDTGVGYKGKLEAMFEEGIGLSNISKRLKLLYNEPLQVERGEEGLRFYFNIPFEHSNEKESTDHR